MNLKIIHSRFEINLVDTSFNMVEENNWFNKKVFTKYTYPITSLLTDEQIAQLNFITENNASGIITTYKVTFFVLDIEHEGVMDIEKSVGNKIEYQIRYGFEEFPNFNTLLSQLPLHNFELVGETIREHAEARIGLTYPAVDYNFPQVFTQHFDLDSDQWFAFEGVINNYKNSAFPINEYDAGGDQQINRNVLQPFPYLLYLLKVGFADAGFTLEGTILEDPEFKIATLYSLSKYYSSITTAGKEEMIVTTDQYTSIGNPNNDTGEYALEIVIDQAGRYILSGNLFLRLNVVSVGRFLLNGVEIYRSQMIILEGEERFVFMDHIFDVLPGDEPAVLRFEYRGLIYSVVGGTRVYDAVILDATLTQLTAYDTNGNPIPTLISPNEIDLTRCVPKKTFGDLFNIIKGWKNYDITISGTVVTMNFIQDQIGKGPVKDLRDFEVKNPERIFNQAKTIELKFTQVESDDYTFPSILIGINGVEQSPYVKNDDTEEITIDAVALPLTTIGAVRTADGFLDDDSKIQIVLYDGLQGGLNVAKDPSPLSLVTIYPTYYQGWIEFQLKSVTFMWVFDANDQFVKDLNVKSTPFAYGQYHVVKILNKKNVGNDILRVEIELASIE